MGWGFGLVVVVYSDSEHLEVGSRKLYWILPRVPAVVEFELIVLG